MSEQAAFVVCAQADRTGQYVCDLPYLHNSHHQAGEGLGRVHWLRENTVADSPVRQFDTGANRDTEDGKLDIEGFLSPQVLFEYAKYMHSHRLLKDGTLRASDNWQKGIPQDVYVKSLLRHVLDLWLHHRGVPQERPEEGGVPSLDETLGGIVFNICGYWHEALRVQA